MLLEIGDETKRGKGVKVTLYGQEKDNATAALARMNMVLHAYATAEVKQGNTLANPLFEEADRLKTLIKWLLTHRSATSAGAPAGE